MFLPRALSQSRLLSHLVAAAPYRHFAGVWQVSSHGRVKTSTGSVSLGSLNDSGYYCVFIHGKQYCVHRIVARTFIGVPPNPAQWQVNHIDRNPSNNHVTNLQYASPSENTKHSWDTNVCRRPGGAKHRKAVLWRLAGAASWCESCSQAEASRTLGVSPNCISRCCRGLVSNCHGGEGTYEFKHQQIVRPQTLAGEVWKAALYPGIRGLIGDLQVSSHGRVLSTSRHGNPYIWNGYCKSNGYCAVIRAGRHHYVHRLVAATFFGQPSAPSLHVNHKDGLRNNNHIDNLEYVTPSQNILHARTSLKMEGRQRAVKIGKPVQTRSMDPSGPWLHFKTIQAAAAHTGVRHHVVSSLCKGRVAGGPSTHWEFRFANDDLIPGEEWRPVVLTGVRSSRAAALQVCPA